MRRSWAAGVAIAVAIACVVDGAASYVRAQPDAGAAQPQVVAPRLVTFVEAEYPAEAAAAGVEANVELEITIGADGAVTDVRVVEPVGRGFDEAAVAAARRFVFEPARRGGTAMAARIRYRYVFEMRVAEPPPDAGVPDAGMVEPEPDAGVPEVSLDAGVEEQPEVTFGATATVEAPPREVTRHTIEAEELVRIPGTRGDALRAVELLPGVARPPLGAGILIVRGSSPSDSATLLEGIDIPLLYHFGGLTSFIQSRLLERIDFYPGNFSARYGRKIGGVLDVSTRDPQSDRWHAIADVNLIDASLLIEGPVGDNASVAFAARRSYIDFWFENAIPDDVFDVIAAPVYWDYQLLGTWRPTERDRVRLLVYGSSDQLRLVFADPADDPNIRGDFGFQTSFHRVHATWRRRISANLEQEIDLASGANLLEFGIGDIFGVDATIIPVHLQAEWRARLTPEVRITGGFDGGWVAFMYDYGGPLPGQGEGNRDTAPLGSRPIFRQESSDNFWRPAVYFESDLRPIEPLQFVLGLRLDYSSDIDEWAFDPRLVARYSLTEQTTLKMGVGIYSQPPEVQESQPGFGNPNLEMLRSLHTSAGVEHRFDRAWSVSLEGFGKYLWDRVVSTPGGVAPIFVNDGIGRIFGLELGVRAVPVGGNRYSGFLSYTLSRSERRDRDDEWRLFDFDQTHILTASASYRLGRGWEIGATFRLVSGNPYTPITGSIYDANADQFVPLLGMTNAARNPLYHRIDIRVEKQWRWQHWSLAVYLDLINAYNSTSSEGRAYNYDYTEFNEVPGLPFLPSIGVRGEL